MKTPKQSLQRESGGGMEGGTEGGIRRKGGREGEGEKEREARLPPRTALTASVRINLL